MFNLSINNDIFLWKKKKLFFLKRKYLFKTNINLWELDVINKNNIFDNHPYYVFIKNLTILYFLIFFIENILLH